MELLDEQKQALKANLAVMRCIDGQVDRLERSILAKAKLREDYKALKTVSGIGEILAVTIALETGDIGRFAGPGNFASYARMVDSRRESNGKKKGEAMSSAATSIWPGPSSRRRTSRCVTTRRSNAGTRRSALPACPLSPSRRWHTSWRAPATTSSRTARHSRRPRHSVETDRNEKTINGTAPVVSLTGWQNHRV